MQSPTPGPDAHAEPAPRLRVAVEMIHVACAIVLLGLLAGSAGVAAGQASPGGPGEVVSVLKQCWETRDIARYRELFTDDYRFAFGMEAPWTREDELLSATHLFVGGSATEPAASSITLTFGGDLQPGPDLRPGKTYPWHQQILVPSLTLTATRSDGSQRSAGGQAHFFLVKGDSAAIPQELIDRGFRADTSRWYVERWEDMAAAESGGDHAPEVTALAAVDGKAGTPITAYVVAWDPDGDPITSLTAAGIAGASFIAGPGNTVGTLTWTPPAGEVGSHRVTFTAANALSGLAVTRIYVLPPNRAPVASLVATPSAGTAPLEVHADASKSTDGDGAIMSYQFDFGDGTTLTQASPSTRHTYAAGTRTMTVMVTDDNGLTASASSTITVAATVAVLPNLARNPSFEVDTKGWKGYAGSTILRVPGGSDGDFALQITGPDILSGSHGVNDSPDWIRPTAAAGLRYRYAASVRSPSGAGTAKLRITEYVIATGAKLGMATSTGVRLSPEWQTIMVDYTTRSVGSTLDFQVRDFPVAAGEVFLTDNISIRDITTAPGVVPANGEPELAQEDELPLQPVLRPCPVQSHAVLSFATSRSGDLRVEILDLAGRRVRQLMNEIEASPGMHVLSISAAGDDGRRLSPGVYFYRIEAREGVRTGRFVMLR